jgi:L-ascorbate metabolism protein UlaG (beta-lactamase superfamily)
MSTLRLRPSVRSLTPLLLLACSKPAPPPEPAPPAPGAALTAEASAAAPVTTTVPAASSPPAPTAPARDVIPTEQGEIAIVPLLHGTLRLELGKQVVYVDPYKSDLLADAPKADLVLITDIHPDHFDPPALDKVRKLETKIVAPPVVTEKVPGATPLKNGAKTTVDGLAIEAVPMYNLTRGPKPGALFHDKGRGNGYVLTWGGKRIYLAGDTECTKEMRALTNIDVAFVPMNLPYTMPPEEAAECVKAFRPKIVYPYHYRGSDLSVFQSAVSALPNVEVRLRDWYPPGS